MASQGGKSMRQSRGETLTTSYTSRVTKGGRKLNYQLSVIQQPERARACGSGAKSSADRRPVDPPPVVELRIFDGGDKGEQDGGEDVTFAYNANFFLFATLEVSRPILSGRVQAAPSNQPPVLTGMPVSGMAYLDRPKEAGYFIFPDLSVRHEGRYKLSFNLYEETKEEKDTDAEPAENKPKGLSGPGTPDSSFDWRLEVKSSEFTVFSAKKFPGLTESTSLSRTVAEQGCRVRIRRDVRMRRRDGKADGFDETTAQEDEYARVGRSHEQEDYHHRSRSNSGASPDGRSPYPDSPYHQPGPPHNGFNGQGPPSNLQWLGQHQGQQQAFAQPQMPSQPQYQAPPPPPPPHNPYHQEQQQYRHVAPQHPRPATDPYRRAHPQSAFPSESPRPPREFEQIRRQSVPVNNYGPAPNPHFNGHYSDPNQNHAPFTPYVTSRPKSPPMAAQYSLPPMHGSVPTEPKHERPPGTVLPTVDNLMNTRQPYSPTFERVQERAAPSYGSSNIHSGPITAAIPVAVEPNRNGSKRPYDSVFRSSISNEALHNGMRPSSPHEDEDDDEDFIARAKMVYKRADGSHMDRQIPPPTRD